VFELIGQRTEGVHGPNTTWTLGSLFVFMGLHSWSGPLGSGRMFFHSTVWSSPPARCSPSLAVNDAVVVLRVMGHFASASWERWLVLLDGGVHSRCDEG